MAIEIDFRSHYEGVEVQPPNPLSTGEFVEGIYDCRQLGPDLGDYF